MPTDADLRTNQRANFDGSASRRYRSFSDRLSHSFEESKIGTMDQFEIRDNKS